MSLERWAGVVAGLGAGLGLLYYMYAPRLRAPEPAPEPLTVEVGEAPAEAPAAEPPPPEPAEATPEVLAPAVPDPAAPAAPAAPRSRAATDEPADLAASDGTLTEAAEGLFGADAVEAFLVETRIIQNVVATVDSLDREAVPLRFRAVREVPELPVVDQDGDRLTLAPENAGRYALLMGAVERADARKVVSFYRHYEPLFERAYREMGYPDARFGDRVLQIIDHLLAAPELEAPVELVRPKVLYHFADPALEELSSGQKMMIRIGPDHARVVKQKLRELRAALVAGAPRG